MIARVLLSAVRFYRGTHMSNSQSLTGYSRFVLYVLVLPLLFIAGVQLFVLSEQTNTYFAWTFASPLPAAFTGAGYWVAMFHAYSGVRSNNWAYLRTSMSGALTATTLLSVTTFLHLDKFHLNSPLLITLFVTWCGSRCTSLYRLCSRLRGQFRVVGQVHT